ncbi:glycosyltransferase [Shewanella baltica]|uniref:glycosyltransferase n=1 Tax=Shewanella baltica TaxID=62322 RepID=UPI003D7A1121
MNIMKKKILVIGPLSSGHIQNWLGHYEESNVRIITCHKFRGDCNYDFRCSFFINQFISFLIFPFYLFYQFLFFRPNIVHVHFLSSYGLLCSFLPAKKIISIWGTDFNGRMSKNRFSNMLYCFILKRYDIINAPSIYITDKLVSYGFDPKSILTLQYGVDIDFLSSFISEKKHGEIIFSSIRNWDSLYQIEELIKVWEDIALPNYKLRIFGKSNNPIVVKKISQLVENSSANIELVGFLKGSQFYKLLSESRAFVSIPIMDGIPLSVLECMALNLVPILSDIPANHEIACTLDNVFLDIPLNAQQLKDVILKIVLDSDLDSVTNVNHDYVCKNADIRLNRCKMFQCYNDLIKKV